MEKREKKTLIILVVLGIVSLIVGLISSNVKYGQKIDYEVRNLENCKNDFECDIPYMEYRTINIKINNKSINKLVTKINKKTDELYEKSKNSNLKALVCESMKDKFKYRMIYQNIFDTYENSEIISIAIARNTIDVCNEKNNSENVEVYYYDKIKTKFLSQKDIFKRLSIKNIDIEKKIAKNVFKVNQEQKKDYKYYNTKVNGKLTCQIYFDYKGDLYAYYKQFEDNKYFNLNLGYSIKELKRK